MGGPFLLIAGIYFLISGTLQISRHYGLKGKGARIGGVICIVASLGLFAIPSSLFVNSLGLGQTASAVINVILATVIFFMVLIALVKIYGNAFAKAPNNDAEGNK